MARPRKHNFSASARTWGKALEYAAMLSRTHNSEAVVLVTNREGDGLERYMVLLAEDVEEWRRHNDYRPLLAVRSLRPMNAAVKHVCYASFATNPKVR